MSLRFIDVVEQASKPKSDAQYNTNTAYVKTFQCWEQIIALRLSWYF